MRDSHYRITLDITETQSQVSLTVKAGETNRRLYVSLVEGSQPYEIDGTKCSAVFNAKRADGSKFQDYCIIEGNKIRYDFTRATTAKVPGLMECDISLHNIETGVTLSPHFSIIVDMRVLEAPDISKDDRFTFDSLIAELGDIKGAENERISAEVDRKSMWNNVTNNPKIWKLKNGCYYVSGYVAITAEEGFYVADRTVLYVASTEEDKKGFVLYLAFANGIPYDVVTGITDGTTAKFGSLGSSGLSENAVSLLLQILKEGTYNTDVSEFIKSFEDCIANDAEVVKTYEVTNNKVNTINKNSTELQYPTAKAVYEAIKEFSVPDKTANVKWCAMGDSITQGYVGYMNGSTGTYKKSPEDAWASKLSKIKEWDITNEAIGKTGWLMHNDDTSDAAWNIAATIDFKQFDVVTLAYGINDWSFNLPLGTIEDNHTTPTTIYGAMRKTIETIIASNPLCKIFVITPLNRMGQYMEDSNGNPVYLKEEYNWALGLKKTKAGTLEDVFEAMKNVCEYYGIEMIDMTHSSIVNRKNVPVCLPDNVHPSAETHTAIARELSAKINFI